MALLLLRGRRRLRRPARGRPRGRRARLRRRPDQRLDDARDLQGRLRRGRASSCWPRRPSGCATAEREAARARATATGRRSTPPGRSSRRPRTCSCGSAPGPRHRRRAGHADVQRSTRTRRAPLDRPLLAPLLRGAGGGGRGARRSRPFLADPGRRARIYADLAPLACGVDVLDRRSGGHDRGATTARRPAAAGARAVVPEPTLLGGDRRPGRRRAARRHRRAARHGDARRHRRRAQRRRGGRGRRLRARVAAEPPDGYARAVTPLWGSLKFFRAVGVLQAPWAAERARAVPAVRHAARSTRRTRSPSRPARRAPPDDAPPR